MESKFESNLAVLKALYDYEPTSDDEIALKEDQLLYLVEKVDEDWWKVKVKGDGPGEDGPPGLVPSAYVEQAEHKSVVKALYDYEAVADGELTISEDEILLAFQPEDDWLLVQSTKEGGMCGYVPANYVETYSEEEGEEEEEVHSAPQIVVPPSAPRPISTYVDPAVRVASSKLSADDIQTWSVSEHDKKGKKTKGTLGIGNGAVFFASESSKAAVQKWQTSDVVSISIDKTKHVHFDVGGVQSTNLHFSASSKDNAEAIVAKLESSRDLSAPPPSPVAEPEPEKEEEPQEEEPYVPPRAVPPPINVKDAKKATVHFSQQSPVVIPPSEHSVEDDPIDGDAAIVLYDFKADGDDELSVNEGEQLLVLEKDGDEWWKCRNVHGDEGVVPASYIQLGDGDADTASVDSEAKKHEEEEEEELAAEAAEAAREKERREAARKREEREHAERERQEKERKKRDAQERARKAAEAADQERERRLKSRSTPSPSSPEPVQSKRTSKPETTSGSIDNGKPPADRVRIWHDRTGQFRVDAAFLGFKDGKLRLHKTNGVIVEVPSDKMSVEDMRYVERLSKKKTPTRRPTDDDDIPLALQHPNANNPNGKSTQPPQPKKKGPTVDWFEFFLNAGCDIDDCTRYAASFERDKIDHSILQDITDSTMRSLGLREGDIIRVGKAIATMKPPLETPKNNTEQISKDEALARELQAQENAGRKTPPSLFSGPGGALKPRRGRPKTSNTLPSAVDLNTIGAISEAQRTGSPQLVSPVVRPSSTPAQAPSRTSSAMASVGFDDNAWTPRSKPQSPAPAAALQSSSTPAPAEFVRPATTTPAPVPVPSVVPAPPASAPPAQSHPTGLAQTTETDVFNQLARLAKLRENTPAPTPPSIQTPPVAPIYQIQQGPSPSPIPLLQPLNGVMSQPTGQQSQFNLPRGPFAPVPANQGLLQPLIPTQTGFNSFIPTRPTSGMNNGSMQSPFANPPQQSFIQSQPTGYPAPNQQSSFLQSQPTGYSFGQPMGQPLMAQATGMPFGGMNSMQTGSFGVMSNPTGFNPGFSSPFNNSASPPPLSTSSSSSNNNNNTNPANIFAQMKSGTFASDNDSSGAQPSQKYDALRPNVAQPTGWGGGYNTYGGY